jgi:antitoxin HicB
LPLDLLALTFWVNADAATDLTAAGVRGLLNSFAAVDANGVAVPGGAGWSGVRIRAMPQNWQQFRFAKRTKFDTLDHKKSTANLRRTIFQDGCWRWTCSRLAEGFTRCRAQNHMWRHQDGSIWVAFGHASGSAPWKWHLGGTHSPEHTHCASVICFGGWHDGVAEWLHQKGAENSKIGIGLGKRTAQTVEKAKMKNQNIGSNFDDFLKEDGMLEEVTAVAVKRVIAWQIEQEMAVQKITKTAMAKKMHTSRASLNRLLDENDTSLTLTTLAGAAAALGRRIKLELAPVWWLPRCETDNFQKRGQVT